jgi:hypothetical protein
VGVETPLMMLIVMLIDWWPVLVVAAIFGALLVALIRGRRGRHGNSPADAPPANGKIAAADRSWSNGSMDWDRAASDFEPDGSLRDIYVFGTDLSDWQRVLDALRTWRPGPNLRIDGEPAAIPDKAEEIFARARKLGASLSVEVADALVNCHFFREDEIEFDLDPRDVAGPEQLEALGRFMRILGEATGKPVVMTMENRREAVILRYARRGQQAEWVPPSAR